AGGGEGRVPRPRAARGSPPPAGSSPPRGAGGDGSPRERTRGDRGDGSPRESTSGQAPLALGARGLAALYAGTPVATLRRAGLADGGSPDADAALDAAFAATPFMLDGF